MTTELMVTVTFIPQFWMGDYAQEADPEGPITWEVPAHMVEDIEPYTYEADDLRFEGNAPEWIREWAGPFEVMWLEA